MPRSETWRVRGGGTCRLLARCSKPLTSKFAFSAYWARRQETKSASTAPWSLRERLSEDMIRAMACAYCREPPPANSQSPTISVSAASSASSAPSTPERAEPPGKDAPAPHHTRLAPSTWAFTWDRQLRQIWLVATVDV